jgi:hypothetical protein
MQLGGHNPVCSAEPDNRRQSLTNGDKFKFSCVQDKPLVCWECGQELCTTASACWEELG